MRHKSAFVMGAAEMIANAGVDPEMVARGGIKTCRSMTSNQNTLKLLDSLTGEL